ncbi:MAG: hypothetical protein ACPG5R_00590 [Cognaticolwellia aestuarii]
MNQSILFNDDLHFDKSKQAWCLTAQIAGALVKVYFYSTQLKQLTSIDRCTQYDLEEITELWLESNEPQNGIIEIDVK